MPRVLFEAIEASVLFATAGFALLAWYRLKSDGSRSLFWLIAGAGTALLALDELTDAHERIGYALYQRGLREPNGVNHMDDLLLMAIAVLGLAVILWAWPELKRERPVLVPFALGGVLFAAAVLWDAFASTKGSASWWFEETLELAGGLFMAAAFRRKWTLAAPAFEWQEAQLKAVSD